MVHQTFYMIYVEGERTPTYKHTNLESVTTEAKRLARTLNKKAYILKAFASVAIKEYDIDHFVDIPTLENAPQPSDNPDDLPF